MNDNYPLNDVMIADDDQDDFDMLRCAIEELSLNINISRSENGDILLESIEKRIPDLLFLDVFMPCRDGKSCIREIRSNGKYDDLPVIIYTGNRDPDMVSFFYRYRANYFLHKPVEFDSLIDVVKRIFSMDRSKLLSYTTESEFVINE